MHRFNIAYVPQNKSNSFITLICDFNKKTHNYCLGKNSLPHVTICQFMAYKNQIDQIWQTVCSTIEGGTTPLTFKKLSLITLDGANVLAISTS